MKMKIRKWSIILTQFIFAYLFLILVFVVITTFYFLLNFPKLLPQEKEFEVIIGIMVLYTGIFINLINYKIAFDQFFKSLFTEFNKRFDSMNDALNAIREGESTLTIEGKSKSKEAIILDYLNLCAEEFLWYSKGRIECNVWKSWRKGMDFYLLNSEFSEILNKAKVERESYYGLFDELE